MSARTSPSVVKCPTWKQRELWGCPVHLASEATMVWQQSASRAVLQPHSR